MKHKTLHGIKHITTDRCKIAVQYRLGEMWIFKNVNKTYSRTMVTFSTRQSLFLLRKLKLEPATHW